MIPSKQDFEKILEDLKNPSVKWVAIDTEFYGQETVWSKKPVVDFISAELAGVSIAYADKGYYLPVKGLGEGPFYTKDDLVRLFTAIKTLGKVVWAHNAIVEISVLSRFIGEAASVNWCCTMVLAHVTSEGVYKDNRYRYGLKDLVKHHLGHRMATYEETVGEQFVVLGGPTKEEIDAQCADLLNSLTKPGKPVTKTALGKIGVLSRKLHKQQIKRRLQMNELHPEDIERYATDDAVQTIRLARKLWPKLKEMGYVENFVKIEAPLLWVTKGMHEAGFVVDKKFIENTRSKLAPMVKDLEQKFTELSGASISSAPQCGQRLYYDLKLWTTEGVPVTDSGKLAVNKEAVALQLNTLPPDSLGYRLAKMKQTHAKMYKMINTYTYSLIKQLDFRNDGRVRSSWHVTGTETGRYSSSNPNFQNIAKSTDPEIPNIREAFTTSPGKSLVVGDFSQLEVVILAHFSRDEALLKSILEGKNLHDMTVEMTGATRPQAKAARFAWQYLAKSSTIARSLKCSNEEAKKIYDGLCKLHVGVVTWWDATIRFAHENGYTTTLFGRRRYLPMLQSGNQADVRGAERQCVNFPIQGTAADICKASMVALYKSLQSVDGAAIIAQVHDEIVVECLDQDVENVKELMRVAMEDTTTLSLPLKADIHSGRNWSEAKG